MRHRRFGTGTGSAISPGWDGSFGPRLCPVHDDVGVRFGGSEHHRIETSSSHTRPPPYGAGHPANGTGQTARLGVPRASFHGVRQAAPFGAPGVRPHRGTANGALRSPASTASPGQGTRRVSAHQAPHPTRDREPDLFGGTAPHLGTAMSTASSARNPGPRGTANGALRSPACTASAESGRRRPSGHREPVSTGQGRRRPSGHREPRPTGTGNPTLLGASGPPPHPGQGTRRASAHQAPHLGPGQGTGPPRRHGTPPHRVRTLSRHGNPAHGAGRRRASAHRGLRLTGTRQVAPLGASRARTRRERDTALLGARRPLPPEQGTEPPRRIGTPASARAGTPAPPRQPELLGAPRVRNGLVPGPLRRPRTPIPRDAGTPPLGVGPPATRG